MPMMKEAFTVAGRSTEEHPTAITRCAVSKVDLKGRIVYVDDLAQKIFGCASENLFGKQMIDLVDEQSRAAVHDILSRRNNYETTFDHLHLTIVRLDGSSLPVETVVTLNFNAGNPVNFQFILTPVDETARRVPVDPDAGLYRQFAEYIAEKEVTADWHGYLRELCALTGAYQACAYIILPDHLEHRSSALESADGAGSLPAITEPGQLHRLVADSGEVYDFTDDLSVRRAVEFNATAPNEVVARVVLGDESRFLIRVFFGADLEDAAARTAAERARFALALTTRLAAPPAPPTADRDEQNSHFALGVLDGLSIGAAITDAAGQLALYNPTFAELLCLEEVGGGLADLAKLLGTDPADFEHAKDYLARGAADRQTRRDPLPVDLPGGRRALLAHLALCDDSDDLTCCIALIPGPAEASAADAVQFARTALAASAARAEATVKLAEQFGRKFAGKLPDNGGAEYTRLSTSTQDLARSIRDLAIVTENVNRAPELELTDLGITVHRVTNSVNRRHPGLPLRVHADVMPKIIANRRMLTLALEQLLSAVADAVDRSTVTVQVSAEKPTPADCLIRVTVNGLVNARADLYPVGTAAAHLMLRHIGGALQEKSSDQTTTLTLTVPVQR